MGQMLVEREAALREVLDWEAGLQALHAQRIAASYRSGLVSGFWRKDCWGRWSARMDGRNTLGTRGVQRLLAVYH